MYKLAVIAATTAVLAMAGCEGQRVLDNPDNLDNMPVEADRVEDSADLHPHPVPITGMEWQTTASAAP